MTTNLSGRRVQAARNDGAILAAARDVFLEDPKAPIAAVAERAGVGISALYRRYKGKDDLLRTLCHDGLRTYIAEAEAAAGAARRVGRARRVPRGVVDADVHSLTVHLAGTFTPTPEMGADAVRAGDLAADLVARAHEDGSAAPGRRGGGRHADPRGVRRDPRAGPGPHRRAAPPPPGPDAGRDAARGTPPRCPVRRPARPS